MVAVTYGVGEASGSTILVGDGMDVGVEAVSNTAGAYPRYGPAGAMVAVAGEPLAPLRRDLTLVATPGRR